MREIGQDTLQNAKEGHQCVHMADVLADATRLCHVVAGSDLEGFPLYLVRQSLISAEFGNAEKCYGYTLPSAALYYRAYINPWLGFGPCAVINDIALAEDFDPEDLEYATRAVVLHELAHILDRDVLCVERRDEPAEKIQFESLVVANATRQSPRSERPPYAGHGPSFLRLVVHLSHRANAAGFDASPAAIFAGHRHRLSPASQYQDALEDEPSQQINNRLRDLPSVELPSRFLEVWNSDVQHYERQPSSANGVGR